MIDLLYRERPLLVLVVLLIIVGGLALTLRRVGLGSVLRIGED